ncbi:hypothetical protein NDU88_001298 [Pleurodeles waltl]|uniref:Uncharacterized protein n=1 Tax=Pleurodeles waltl TaxID=8319 RepID=A0AAV7VX54_PLEWA|nr:hypothetical protein NDU88_001298 [Pleurodeles waltl]
MPLDGHGLLKPEVTWRETKGGPTLEWFAESTYRPSPGWSCAHLAAAPRDQAAPDEGVRKREDQGDTLAAGGEVQLIGPKKKL